MKKIILLMALLLFVGMCFTAQSENQKSLIKRIKIQLEQPPAFVPIPDASYALSLVLPLPPPKHQPSFFEIAFEYFRTVMRYTFFLALGLGFIGCFVSIWGIPIMALRDFYRFINRRIRNSPA